MRSKSKNSKMYLIPIIIGFIFIIFILGLSIYFFKNYISPKNDTPVEIKSINEDLSEKESVESISEDSIDLIETLDALTCDEIILNDVKLTMIDMTATDVENALNITFDETIMSKKINQSSYECLTYHPGDNENYIANFYFFNVKKDPKLVSDCILCGVQLHNNLYMDNGTLADFTTFDVGDGITEKTTEKELVNLLGEPDELEEGKKRGLTRYDYYTMFGLNDDGTSKRDFEVNFNDYGFYELQIGYF